ELLMPLVPPEGVPVVPPEVDGEPPELSPPPGASPPEHARARSTERQPTRWRTREERARELQPRGRPSFVYRIAKDSKKSRSKPSHDIPVSPLRADRNARPCLVIPGSRAGHFAFRPLSGCRPLAAAARRAVFLTGNARTRKFRAARAARGARCDGSNQRGLQE